MIEKRKERICEKKFLFPFSISCKRFLFLANLWYIIDKDLYSGVQSEFCCILRLMQKFSCKALPILKEGAYERGDRV